MNVWKSWQQNMRTSHLCCQFRRKTCLFYKMMQLSQSLCTLTFTSIYPFFDINLQVHSQAFKLQTFCLFLILAQFKKPNRTKQGFFFWYEPSFYRNSVFCHVVFLLSVPQTSCLKEPSSLKLSFACEIEISKVDKPHNWKAFLS